MKPANCWPSPTDFVQRNTRKLTRRCHTGHAGIRPADTGRFLTLVLVISLVVTGAVCREVYKWISDSFLGTHFQINLNDTMKDLLQPFPDILLPGSNDRKVGYSLLQYQSLMPLTRDTALLYFPNYDDFYPCNLIFRLNSLHTLSRQIYQATYEQTSWSRPKQHNLPP